MNNLLRTLTETRTKPPSDLKLLLTAVKETRKWNDPKLDRFDAKQSEVFHESLDNLLADLRTITIDNRDAEAFLKPVSRQEVPDYYDYITTPMDFATIGRKVKTKSYKSKREFKDDLDLIWSNCYKYNAAEDHPLRQCADRLKVKAERLLRHITDRKDRIEPPIPFDMAQPGIARPKLTNGVVATAHRRTASSIPQAPTPPAPIASTSSRKMEATPFEDSPGIVRTPEGMVLFRELDRGLHAGSPAALAKLKDFAPFAEHEDSEPDDQVLTGDKRKLNGADDGRPRKRARFALPDDLAQLWWTAVQSDSLLANGLPEIPYAASAPLRSRKREKKKRKEETAAAKSMLALMNGNIKALKRVRQTHAKISALAASTTGPDDADDGGFGAGPTASMGTVGGLSAPMLAVPTNDDDAVSDDKIDERHWTDIAQEQQRGRRVEIGEENAKKCTRWVGEKVLEHAGFQGASKAALDVYTGVFEDFLANMGRSIRFLTDKYSRSMTPEEIILHTLFESGVSKVSELERFVTDDIERHGTRLLELEKKLVNAYRDATTGDILEEEGLFEEDEEEEAGALALGDFAESLGEDYLGLRESGIAQEFGLSTLSIPKSLLRRKKAAKLAQAKPAEKPLDYPLPPPPIPFTHSRLPQTIGLLRPYYEKRFELRARTLLPQPYVPTAQPGAQLQPLAGPVIGGTAPSVLMPPPPSVPGVGLTNLPGPSLTNLPGPTLPGPKLPPPPGPALYPPNPYPTPTPAAGPSGLPQMPATAPKPPPTPTPTFNSTLPPTSTINPSSLAAATSAPMSPSVPTFAPAAAPPSSSFPVPLLQPPPPLVIPPDMDLPDDPVPFAQAKMGPLGQITKPNANAVSSSKKKSGGGAGGSSSNPPSAFPGGGGGGTTTTFIPTIIGPNGQNSTHMDGRNPSPAKKVGPDGQPTRGPGRPPKKKDPPPGLVLPVSATTSQASSNGGYVMASA